MASQTERETSRELIGALNDSTGSYELVVAAVAAALLGLWIDSVIGTTPLFVLVFGLVGFIGASYSLYARYQMRMGVASAERAARSEGGDS